MVNMRVVVDHAMSSTWVCWRPHRDASLGQNPALGGSGGDSAGARDQFVDRTAIWGSSGAQMQEFGGSPIVRFLMKTQYVEGSIDQSRPSTNAGLCIAKSSAIANLGWDRLTMFDRYS